MKIVIAPDSFKGSLSAVDVSDSIERGILKVIPEAEIIKLPMSDGGEGLVNTILTVLGGTMVQKEVTGPLGDKVLADFAIVEEGQTAVIEMAEASGLPLVPPDQRNPLLTTTYGTGELIKAALDKNVKKIIIGIGGSATNDAGVGMAQALGVKFLDKEKNCISFGGGELNKIEKIDLSDLDPRIKDVEVKVACDVNNPLYGHNGAAYIYGPQKGATKEVVRILDDNLSYIGKKIKDEMGIDLQNIPGAGAAGGLGAGLVAFLDGKLVSGLDIVLNTYNIEEIMKDTSLVITGEGKIDEQSVNGKVTVGVAKKAKSYGIPVIALAGTVNNKALKELNKHIDAIFSIIPAPVDLDEAFSKSSKWIEHTIEQVFKLLRVDVITN